MDEDELRNRNWGYYEQNLGFQLIPSIINRNEKPSLFTLHNNQNITNVSSSSSSNGFMPFPRDYSVSEPPFMSYSWLNHHRDSNLPNPLLVPAQPMQQLLRVPKSEDEFDESLKRRHEGDDDGPKVKRERKVKETDVSRVQRERSPLRKSVEMVINGVSMDIGCLPLPICSCTGFPQPCYRWGCGGWQSACCTTNVSMYPLPMNTKRRGARIAGRKMSQGAFRKVLEKLSSDGFDFSNPIDLKSHWAKHGTNKFVTIR